MARASARSVVERQRVTRAIERELARRDSVAAAADERPEIRIVLHVGLDRVETEHDVFKRAFPVWNEEPHDRAAEVADFDADSARVLQREKTRRASVG